MKGYLDDIEALAIANTDFRRVLYTAEHSQLVLMSLQQFEDIGDEVHTVDQFFRIESGSGAAELNGHRTPVHAGSAVLVPAGTRHNIINTSSSALKLYTIYSPPQHKDHVVHRTKNDANLDLEHFAGRTSE